MIVEFWIWIWICGHVGFTGFSFKGNGIIWFGLHYIQIKDRWRIRYRKIILGKFIRILWQYHELLAEGLTNHDIEEHQELDVSCHSGICPIGILIKYQGTLYQPSWHHPGLGSATKSRWKEAGWPKPAWSKRICLIRQILKKIHGG